MSQRNPMNERYTTDKGSGKTRRSAASAKPKTKAAASVSYSAPKKTTQERKAEIKEQRKADEAKQRELDRKYYKPDTPQYKKLRLIWAALIGGGVICVVASWLLRSVEPTWIGTAFLIVAYMLILGSFWIDFSKIRKERRAYQTKMLAKEIEENKKQKKEQK